MHYVLEYLTPLEVKLMLQYFIYDEKTFHFLTATTESQVFILGMRRMNQA